MNNLMFLFKKNVSVIYSSSFGVFHFIHIHECGITAHFKIRIKFNIIPVLQFDKWNGEFMQFKNYHIFNHRLIKTNYSGIFIFCFCMNRGFTLKYIFLHRVESKMENFILKEFYFK